MPEDEVKVAAAERLQISMERLALLKAAAQPPPKTPKSTKKRMRKERTMRRKRRTRRKMARKMVSPRDPQLCRS